MHKSYEPVVYIVYLILEGLKQIFTVRVFQKKSEGLLDSNFCFYISINCFYIHINIGVRKGGGFRGQTTPRRMVFRHIYMHRRTPDDQRYALIHK